MHFLQVSTGFNWKQLLLGNENWSFLAEIVLRTSIMFLVLLISLRLLGKRGVKQLSVFELVVIIGFGSAAGDPMIYKDVGILPAILVFGLIVSFYSIVTYFVGTNKRFELLIEGKPVCLIKNGKFSIENFSKEKLGEDEFFAELRLQGVSHLGQIEEAIVESSGNISIFFYQEEAVKYGLPIMPQSLESFQIKIIEEGYYSCIFCGHTEIIIASDVHRCPNCTKNKWIKASIKKRIS